MRIVEKRVSAGDRELFDLDEFLSRPLYAHLSHASEHGPRDSPVCFHWDGEALWIIGGTTFLENLRREPRCAIGVVDWDRTAGISQQVGLRGRAEVLPFDTAVARAIFGSTSAPTSRAGIRGSARTSTGRRACRSSGSRPRRSSCATNPTVPRTDRLRTRSTLDEPRAAKPRRRGGPAVGLPAIAESGRG